MQDHHANASTSISAFLQDYAANTAAYQLPVADGWPRPPQGDAILKIAAGKWAALNVAEATDTYKSQLERAARHFIRHVCLAQGASHYQILCVADAADAEVVKDHFRQMVSLVHPDHHQPEGEAWPTECVQQVIQANAVLSDPELRRAYDRDRAERDFAAAGFAAPFAYAGESRAAARSHRRSRNYDVRGILASSIAVLVLLYLGNLWWVSNLPSQYSTLEGVLPRSISSDSLQARESGIEKSPLVVAAAPAPTTVRAEFMEYLNSPEPLRLDTAFQILTGKQTSPRRAEPPRPMPALPMPAKTSDDRLVLAAYAGIRTPAADESVTSVAPVVPVQQSALVPAPVISDALPPSLRAQAATQATTQTTTQATNQAGTQAPTQPATQAANETPLRPQGSGPGQKAAAAAATTTAEANEASRKVADNVELMLIRLVHYYETGDIDKLVGLFDAEDAQVGQRVTTMRRDYEAFFRATESRRVLINNLAWKTSPNGVQAKGEGLIRATYLDQRGPIERRSNVEVDIAFHASGPRIVRLVLFPNGN